MKLNNYNFDPFSKTIEANVRYEICKLDADREIQLKNIPAYNTGNSTSVGIVDLGDAAVSFTEQENMSTGALSPALSSSGFVVDYAYNPDVAYTANCRGSGKIKFGTNGNQNDCVVVKYQCLGTNIIDDRVWGDYDSNLSILSHPFSTSIVINYDYFPRAIEFYDNNIYILNSQNMLKFEANNIGTVTSSTSLLAWDSGVDYRCHTGINKDGKLIIGYEANGGSYEWRISNAALDSVASFSTTGYQTAHTKGGSIQVGNCLCVCSGNTFDIINLDNFSAGSTAATTTFSVGAYTFEYPLLAYYNGDVYVLGNRNAGNEGQSIKVSLYDHSVSAVNVGGVGSNYKFINNSAVEINGKIYAAYSLSYGNNKIWAWDVDNNNAEILTTNDYNEDWAGVGSDIDGNTADTLNYNQYMNGLTAGKKILMPNYYSTDDGGGPAIYTKNIYLANFSIPTILNRDYKWNNEGA